MTLTAALLLGAFAAFAPTKAGACSCAEPPPLAEDMAGKTAVFSGRVLEIAEPEQVRSSADPVYVRFEVDTVWKGGEETQRIVKTAIGGDSCGYDAFERGRAYVVFASGSPDRLETGLCTRTAPLEAAGETVAALGIGAAPTKAVDLTIQVPGNSSAEGESDAPVRWLYALAAALFISALVSALVLIGVRRGGR
jgi:hypothetical protein